MQATHALRSCALTLTLLQVLHRMDERPDDDFTALEFTGSLEAYVGTLDAAAAAVRAGGAAAMAMDEDVDNGVEAGATPATSKGQKKKAAAAKSKPVAALGIQKGVGCLFFIHTRYIITQFLQELLPPPKQPPPAPMRLLRFRATTCPLLLPLTPLPRLPPK